MMINHHVYPKLLERDPSRKLFIALKWYVIRYPDDYFLNYCGAYQYLIFKLLAEQQLRLLPIYIIGNINIINSVSEHMINYLFLVSF